eukprot:TRINITY_DN32792_c0_g1_i1.p1 TRINITY_DN32792_c0_g1~~TRINITY_DN32792_c0_g1_i1.p1  ORF type:complete len:182 (-),score=60.81 TRINITY_DN32792_c0_g1_i1:84-629(-)
MLRSLVGSEMCIRDRDWGRLVGELKMTGRKEKGLIQASEAYRGATGGSLETCLTQKKPAFEMGELDSEDEEQAEAVDVAKAYELDEGMLTKVRSMVQRTQSELLEEWLDDGLEPVDPVAIMEGVSGAVTAKELGKWLLVLEEALPVCAFENWWGRDQATWRSMVQNAVSYTHLTLPTKRIV